MNIKKYERKYSKFISMYEKETGRNAIYRDYLTERFIHWLKQKKYRDIPSVRNVPNNIKKKSKRKWLQIKPKKKYRKEIDKKNGG